MVCLFVSVRLLRRLPSDRNITIDGGVTESVSVVRDLPCVFQRRTVDAEACRTLGACVIFHLRHLPSVRPQLGYDITA